MGAVEPPYVERRPTAGLREAVRRLWRLRVPSPERFERIVPLPAVHLIVNLADEPYRVIARGREPVGEHFPRAFLSGVQLDYLLNENPAEIHHVGAEIHPWALGAWGIVPADAAQRVQAAAPLLPGIDEVGDLDGFEALLLRRLDGAWRPDPRVVIAVTAISDDPSLPMRDLAAAAGLTPQGFIAAFRRACGVTPKRFAEVCRHQAFLAELPAEGELPPWTELVARGGYYDQPHFIREFRRFTGMTPTAYLEHRRRYGHGDPSFLAFDEVNSVQSG